MKNAMFTTKNENSELKKKQQMLKTREKIIRGEGVPI